MQYYPSSQLKSNLYTNGGEYILSTTKENYKGYYYETSNGTKYTGKTPQDGPNILLTQQNIITQINNSNQEITNIIILSTPIEGLTILDTSYDENPTINFNYSSLTPQLKYRSLPQPNPTLPNQQDYILGSFSRYFCKKTNELKYIEIDKETYNKLKIKDTQIAWDLYEPQLIVWQINGNKEGIFLANKSNIALLEKRQKWYGFSQYLKEDYLKYYLAS